MSTPPRCTAITKTTKKRCRRRAEAGHTVCVIHGSTQCEVEREGKRCLGRAWGDATQCEQCANIANYREVAQRTTPLTTAISDTAAQGSLEERLEWMERVRRGEIREQRLSGGSGKLVEIPLPMRDRIAAAKAAEDLRRELEERDTLYVSREQFEASCAAICLVVRDRMRSIAARLFGQDVGAVTRLNTEIDAALVDAGDEVERQLRSVLGDSQ